MPRAEAEVSVRALCRSGDDPDRGKEQREAPQAGSPGPEPPSQTQPFGQMPLGGPAKVLS